MTRERLRIGIVLVGFLLALGTNAWAGHGKHGKHRFYGKGDCQCHKAHQGRHCGWPKGKRHHRAYRHRHHHRPIVVEKRVYHDYRTKDPEPAGRENGFRFTFSVARETIGVSVEVSEIY